MEELERTTIATISRRLIPYLFVLYVVAYLDRVNVGFAQLQMKDDLGFSDEVFGLGAGIFFFGYMLFQVPSNLVLERIGARRLIASIMVIWGTVSVGMMFMRTVEQFYILRFLLGAAEAGFFPGIILYLTYWFPARHRARAVSLFMLSVPVSGVVGSPISGEILELEGHHGLAGWHWLFLLEGLPAVILGFLSLKYLTDLPEHASWLSQEQKDWLLQRLSDEQQVQGSQKAPSPAATFTSLPVWLLSLIYFCLACSFYGMSFWSPQIVKALLDPSASDALVGWLNAIPYVGGAVGMLLVGRSSDRHGERRLHVVLPTLLAALGLVLSGLTSSNPTLSLGAFTLAALGLWGTVGPFWAHATAVVRGTGAAAGIALTNSLGNMGGFAGSYLVAWAKSVTTGFAGGLYLLAAILVVGAVLMLLPVLKLKE